MQPLFYKLPNCKVIFIANPKCATSSLLDAMSCLIDFGDSENPHHRWSPYKIENETALTLKSTHFFVAPIRNPWSRALSCYKDKIAASATLKRLGRYGFRPGMSFGEYARHLVKVYDQVNDVHVRSQIDLLSVRGTLMPDLFIRFERLSEDYQVFRSLMNVKCGMELPKELPMINKKSEGSYRDAYSGPVRKLVRGVYEQDIRFFGYKF